MSRGDTEVSPEMTRRLSYEVTRRLRACPVMLLPELALPRILSPEVTFWRRCDAYLQIADLASLRTAMRASVEVDLSVALSEARYSFAHSEGCNRCRNVNCDTHISGLRYTAGSNAGIIEFAISVGFHRSWI